MSTDQEEAIKPERSLSTGSKSLVVTSTEAQTMLLAKALKNPYITAATADKTRKAYQSDIEHFEAWGGVLPATPEILLAYLEYFAEQLNPRTLSRRLVAIKHWHVYQQFIDPTQSPLIKKMMKGIYRLHGSPKHKAQALAFEQLLMLHQHLKNQESLHAFRDNALLQIGFFGAFRVSELLAIQVEHLQSTPEGLRILIPRSKTDQDGIGAYCAIPFGNNELCPIKTLRLWLDQAGLQEGPVFRFISRWGRMGKNALHPISVNRLLKKYTEQCELSNPECFSSHSLRRGFATAASRQGASLKAIMRQGRWIEVRTVLGYIDEANAFEDNAAHTLLKPKEKDTPP